MKFLITGGSGFLGSRVVPLAVSEGHRVAVLVRSSLSSDQVTTMGATPIYGDMEEPETVDDAFCAAEAEVLINLVSLGFGHAETIVAAAEDAQLSRAVFLSTTAIFTALNPSSKAVRIAAEATITSSVLDWTILRPTMIYGASDDRNMARLLTLLRRLPVLPLPGDGSRLQQPVHVDDVARATVAAATSDVAIGQAYDVAGPTPLTFRQITTEAGAAVSRRPRLVPVPLRPAIKAIQAYEGLVPRPRVRAEQIERLAEDKCFSIEPVRRDLDYSPRTFADGIRAEAAALWP